MNNNFHEQPEELFPASDLRVLPNEIHFALLNQLPTPVDWKNYSKAYPHLTTDDYFWKKLMIKFPTLKVSYCRNNKWTDALDHVDFNFTLNYAAETDNLQLAQQVLDYGGNVYQPYIFYLLFFMIARKGDFDMARLFLNNGFNINTIHKNTTALIMCVKDNNTESVKFLLENGADVNIVTNAIPFSALATSCYHYDFGYDDNIMIQLLTDHGANYNLKNKKNEVALHFLIRGLFKSFFPMGMDRISLKKMFTHFVQKTDMTVINSCNRTLLHELCIYKDEVDDDWPVDILALVKFIITLFLNAGIPINAVDAEGNTALDHAIQHDLDSTLCEFLRQHGGRSRTEIE